MATLNRYECIGNLGKDPMLQVTSDGTPFTGFSVAVSQGKNSQGSDNPALWWNCVTWRELAERAEKFLYKGAKVYLEGALRRRDYTPTGGEKRTAIDFVVTNFQLLSEYKTGAPPEEVGDPFLPDA